MFIYLIFIYYFILGQLKIKCVSGDQFENFR